MILALLAGLALVLIVLALLAAHGDSAAALQFTVATTFLACMTFPFLAFIGVIPTGATT